jgi:hypothetical protein
MSLGSVGSCLLQCQWESAKRLGEAGGRQRVGVTGTALEESDSFPEWQQVNRDWLGDALPCWVARGHEDMSAARPRQEIHHCGWVGCIVE